jgi:biotin synthase-related radical SAM superfamily protein
VQIKAEATTVIKLAMQKEKRTKLFDKQKNEIEQANKSIQGSLKSKIYSLIHEQFTAIKDLDSQFKQTMIDRTKLMESSQTLITFSLNEEKEEFSKSEEQMFKVFEEQIRK